MIIYFDWGSDLNTAQMKRYSLAEAKGNAVQASFTKRPYENWEKMWSFTEGARKAIARLVSADSSKQIVLTQGTMEGIMRILDVLFLDARRVLSPHDSVVATDLEISSVYRQLYPTFNLQVAPISQALNQTELTRAFVSIVTQSGNKPPVKAVFLSHVAYRDGRLLPVQSIISSIRKVDPNIKILVDGAQAVGNVNVDVKTIDADFYVFDFHKWIQGPNFTGAIYCRDEATTRLMADHATHPMSFDRSFKIESTLCSKYGPLPGECAALPAAIKGFLSGKFSIESYKCASKLREMIRNSPIFKQVSNHLLPEYLATGIVTLPLKRKQRGIRRRLLEKSNIHVAEHWPTIPLELQRVVSTQGFVRISCSDNWNTQKHVNLLFDALKEDWKTYS